MKPEGRLMRSMSRISRRTMFAQARAFFGVRAHGTVHLPAKKMHGKSRGLLRWAFRTSSSPSGGYRGVYIVLCICTCTWVIGTSHGRAIGKSMATLWQCQWQGKIKMHTLTVHAQGCHELGISQKQNVVCKGGNLIGYCLSAHNIIQQNL